MSKPKLNQIIAIEKGIKERSHKETTRIYQGMSKTEPMHGITKTYQPINEEGEKLPPESKYVQVKVKERLTEACAILTALFDVTLTKEVGNTKASADVKVGDFVLKGLPVTYLLFLEKNLTDLRTIVASLPTLDPADKWTWDGQQGVFASEPVQTARMKQESNFLVIPGSGVPDKGIKPDVVKVDNNVLAGYWTATKFSATIEPTQLTEWVERIDSLLRAVKFAREEANIIEVDQMKVGAEIFTHIFGSL